MDRSLTRVLVERERLLARTDQQRLAIANACSGLGKPAALIDSALGCGRFVRGHPAALAAIVGSIIVLRARSILGIVTRGIGMWRLLRRLRSTLRLLGY
jgi:hypothetical protein